MKGCVITKKTLFLTIVCAFGVNKSLFSAHSQQFVRPRPVADFVVGRLEPIYKQSQVPYRIRSSVPKQVRFTTGDMGSGVGYSKSVLPDSGPAHPDWISLAKGPVQKPVSVPYAGLQEDYGVLGHPAATVYKQDVSSPVNSLYRVPSRQVDSLPSVGFGTGFERLSSGKRIPGDYSKSLKDLSLNNFEQKNRSQNKFLQERADAQMAQRLVREWDQADYSYDIAKKQQVASDALFAQGLYDQSYSQKVQANTSGINQSGPFARKVPVPSVLTGRSQRNRLNEFSSEEDLFLKHQADWGPKSLFSNQTNTQAIPVVIPTKVRVGGSGEAAAQAALQGFIAKGRMPIRSESDAKSALQRFVFKAKELVGTGQDFAKKNVNALKDQVKSFVNEN